MKTIWVGAAFLGCLTVSAHADTQYDRKLEQAVMDIVANKMGDLRGGFSFDSKPAFVAATTAPQPDPQAMRGAYSATDPWQDGLAPAIERRAPTGLF